MHGHLVTIEVRVERGADERVNTNGLSFYEHGLESLDAESVKGRRAVEQHRVIANDLLKDFIHLRRFLFHNLLGALHRLGDSLLDELMDDERLEQLERHRLGQAALVELELGTDDDDRTARVVDALAEQVLTETTLLALEHVGQRLERTLAATPNRFGAATVVEQCIDCFLEHSLFVAENHFRGAVRDQLHQPVVAVDDATIEIVEIRRREAAAVERNERTQIRWNHRNDIHDQPLCLVALLAGVTRVTERINDLEALEHLLLTMLRAFVDESGAKLLRNLVDVDSLQQLANSWGTDVGEERVVALFLGLRLQVEEFVFVEELVLDHLLLARIDDDVVRVVDDLLEVTQRQIDEVSHWRRQSLEEPDVRDGYGELDVTHALATDAAQGDFDAAAIADHSTVANSLVFAAVAFPVLDRTKNPLAEQTVFLGLERAVVDGLGL